MPTRIRTNNRTTEMNRLKPLATLLLTFALLLGGATAQEQAKKNPDQQQTAGPAISPAATPAPVVGSGTPGKVTKWSGISGSSTYVVGDSVILEDKFGNIGIGAALPTSKLTVAGMIQSLSGGITFPDGTIQTTSATGALFSIPHDSTLMGNGTAGSPLGVAVPLNLSGSGPGSIVTVNNAPGSAGAGLTAGGGTSNSTVGGTGVRAFGGASSSGEGGRGVLALGGSSISGTGGLGVAAGGGNSDSGIGGSGIFTQGGNSNGGSGGSGISAEGGQATGNTGGAGVRAVGGDSDTSEGGSGVRGFGGASNSFTGGTGVLASGGDSTSGLGGIGVLAISGSGPLGTGLAGKFNGDVDVTGMLSKGGGSFKIDHPLDPETRYLYHSFVESPDMKNIYDGNVVTDANGEAMVELPAYFEALNRDFRYQLTVLGTFAQAIVAKKIKDNRFVILTNTPGVEVSWQVTGIRQDGWANKNRIRVEVEKPEQERGYYLHPESFHQPEERGVEWARNPELMKQRKEAREQMKQKQQ